MGNGGLTCSALRAASLFSSSASILSGSTSIRVKEVRYSLEPGFQLALDIKRTVELGIHFIPDFIASPKRPRLALLCPSVTPTSTVGTVWLFELVAEIYGCVRACIDLLEATICTYSHGLAQLHKRILGLSLVCPLSASLEHLQASPLEMDICTPLGYGL